MQIIKIYIFLNPHPVGGGGGHLFLLQFVLGVLEHVNNTNMHIFDILQFNPCDGMGVDRVTERNICCCTWDNFFYSAVLITAKSLPKRFLCLVQDIQDIT